MVAGIPRNNVSTDKDEWQTPPKLFKRLDDEFGIDLDVACTFENCLSRNHYGFTKADDALTKDWNRFMMDNGEDASVFFMNPPYGRGIVKDFVRKAYLETRRYGTAVCLVPFTGSGWFKDYCLHAEEIRIIGRVKYIGYDNEGNLIKNSPTFDSCIVVFTPGYHRPRLEVFEW
jgi:phage N-6-adenine-methyltransferase